MKKKCKICLNKVPKYHSKYCGPECQQEGKRERYRRSVLKTCKLCPRTFYNDKSGHQKYCSVCTKKGRLKTRKLSEGYKKKYPTLYKTCPWCNIYFMCVRSDQVYCKPQCTRSHLRAKKVKARPRKGGTCKICKHPTDLLRHVNCNICGRGKKRINRNGNELWQALED
jgi:hypothetical protein